MRMSNQVYDVLKYIALIVLPALGALYFGLAKIWGFPYATEIVGTISCVDAFLGAVLKISTDQYNNGGNQEQVYSEGDEEAEEG